MNTRNTAKASTERLELDFVRSCTYSANPELTDNVIRLRRITYVALGLRSDSGGAKPLFHACENQLQNKELRIHPHRQTSL